MPFEVKTMVFQGPLDLLLGLIEDRKFLINDISLAEVADDFLRYLQRSKDFPIAETADFLVIASTLVLIKSKSLLPDLDLSEEEQGNIEDLQRRLKILKRMRELGRYIQKSFGLRVICLPEERTMEAVFSPDSSLNQTLLADCVRDILHSFPRRELLPKIIVEKVLSLEEMIKNLTERIKRSIKMSFREFSGMGKERKVTIIVSFLAMLELIKQGLINARQEERFADITIETEKVSVPDYTRE